MPNLRGEFILRRSKEEDSSAQTSPPFSGRQTPHLFSSFAQNPDGVTLTDQENNERVVLLVRRHFVTNTPWLALALFLAVLPILTVPFASALVPFVSLSFAIRFVALSFYYLALFGFALLNFSLWYFNIGIVTTVRVLDMDVTSILFKNVSETRLDRVRDVTYTQIGLARSFLNFGDVFVQTEGVEQNFEFDAAPRPNDVTRIIADLTDRSAHEPN